MPEAANALIINLRHRATWEVICQQYQERQPKPEIAAFLDHMRDEERNAIDLLARALRQLDVRPGDIGIQESLAAEARRRRSPQSELEFIQVGIDRSLAWYQERLQDADDPHHRACGRNSTTANFSCKSSSIA